MADRARRTSLLLQTIVICMVLFFGSVPARAADVPESETVRELIRVKVDGNAFDCRGEMVCGAALLPELYARTGFEPLWTPQRGRELLRVLDQADRDGLEARDYHFDALDRMLGRVERQEADAEVRADLDILLTDGFLLFGSHLLAGRVDPETVHPDWIPFSRHADLSAVLYRALRDGVAEVLDSLRPPHAGYESMREALDRYRDLAARGGWPRLAEGPSLHVGERSSRVLVLRIQLALRGDFSGKRPDRTNRDLFEADLESAVLRFQARHGLEEDGVVGPKTRAALNVSVQDRVRQLEVNLERWRWIGAELGDRYILVNIADFRLKLVEDGDTVMEMPVVVGKNYRQTPVFSKKIQYLVFNPYWNVPHSLASKDILGKVRRDPEYLEKQGFEVFDSWSRDARPLDPAKIDWSMVSSSEFPYRLRQKPGAANALGRVKFMFPNRFAVYLHDTPGKSLFSRQVRNFSSGCIRVQRPLELAARLLQDQPGWSLEEIRELLASGTNRSVSLERLVPVHLQYWTAWADEEGRVNFRKDIYGRDGVLGTALRRRAPLNRELAVHSKG
ncbi:MAG TPA: L,D-transpeptidase family protein [Desulfomicrobiaceae bacterium]|nr:L,D-transpeptidase family protein [Desulfomicrobiaceae bacterium]